MPTSLPSQLMTSSVFIWCLLTQCSVEQELGSVAKMTVKSIFFFLWIELKISLTDAFPWAKNLLHICQWKEQVSLYRRKAWAAYSSNKGKLSSALGTLDTLFSLQQSRIEFLNEMLFSLVLPPSEIAQTLWFCDLNSDTLLNCSHHNPHLALTDHQPFMFE